jgi:GNAT superfamily N-acetyltransferase
MRAHQFVTEVERLYPHDFEGGKDSIPHKLAPQKTYLLPGSSGLTYSFHSGAYGVTIFINEQQTKKVIGALELKKVHRFFVPNTYAVDTITVDEDYRGRGIAKALYGVALTIKHMNLKSGSSQTPGGIKNWTSLFKIPGCEVVGVLQMYESYLIQPGPLATQAYAKKRGDEVAKIIDSLMSIGCVYQGRHDDKHCFIFPLTISKNELAATVKNSVKVYHDGYETAGGVWKTSMLARWVG